MKHKNKTQKKLLDAAQEVSKNSHCPYSHFHVGAALLTDKDEIITGTNFENAAYGSTICAERAAILSANSQGKNKIQSIAIFGEGEDRLKLQKEKLLKLLKMIKCQFHQVIECRYDGDV